MVESEWPCRGAANRALAKWCLTAAALAIGLHAASAPGADPEAPVLELVPVPAPPVPVAPVPGPPVPGPIERLPESPEPQTEMSGESLARINPVVARVGDREIHWNELLAAAEKLPPRYRDDPELAYPALLDRLIDLELLARRARQQGLAEDPDVRRKVEAYEDEVLRETYVERLLAERVTEAELRRRYRENEGEIEQVHLKEIVVAGRPEAEDIIRALGEGAEFEWLARKWSRSETAEEGGDLGFVDLGSLAPAVASALQDLGAGATVQSPLPHEAGWRVLRVTDRRTVERSFAAREDELRETVSQEVLRRELARLREDARIEVFPWRPE